MTPQPFKLIRLPALALRNVLQFLNPIELFELSQCSRRAFSVIPLSGSRKFNLRINERSTISVNGHYFGTYNNSPLSENVLHGTRTFMEFTAKAYLHSEHELVSFWDNRHVGLKAVLFHLSKVFDCAIDYARFSDKIPAVIYMSIIDLISSRQSEIKDLTIWGDGLTDEYVTGIFDKLKVTDHLEMNYQYTVPRSIPFNTKSIVIWNSSWITMEHLKSMNKCTVIQLYRSTITDPDMTLLLNDWKSGQYSNLQYLSIKSSFLSKTFTAFGLPSLTGDQSHEKTILGIEREIYRGVDVRRDDGVVGNIRFNDKEGVLQILVL
ncbi:hypothetical protein GCK72_011381 [Caenorhabditis remanei]|uniref:F-box domain-containing protein n=1 Tax=Caenorhabditis remanei TaxID=31234 RepID=A0A6A5H7M3_CAERE|nr:hypothetical protein GCK72_011381 [Caenorhabditis remanei]KAF1763115.1 hypothetical protein GCK72_011381 [Caenorhabditis remanei]